MEWADHNTKTLSHVRSHPNCSTTSIALERQIVNTTYNVNLRIPLDSQVDMPERWETESINQKNRSTNCRFVIFRVYSGNGMLWSPIFGSPENWEENGNADRRRQRCWDCWDTRYSWTTATATDKRRQQGRTRFPRLCICIVGVYSFLKHGVISHLQLIVPHQKRKRN